MNRKCVALVLRIETGDVRVDRTLLGDERNTTVFCGNEAGKRFAQIGSAWLVDLLHWENESMSTGEKEEMVAK